MSDLHFTQFRFQDPTRDIGVFERHKHILTFNGSIYDS